MTWHVEGWNIHQRVYKSLGIPTFNQEDQLSRGSCDSNHMIIKCISTYRYMYVISHIITWWGLLDIMLRVMPVVKCIQYHVTCHACGEVYTIPCYASCLWWRVYDIMLRVLPVMRLTLYHVMCPACGEVDSISCYVSCLWWGLLNVMLYVLSVVRFTQYHNMCPACDEVDYIMLCVLSVMRLTRYHVMCPACGEVDSISC